MKRVWLASLLTLLIVPIMAAEFGAGTLSGVGVLVPAIESLLLSMTWNIRARYNVIYM